MGACSSCIGLNRDRDSSSEDENSRLLFEDAHANHYGSFGDQGAGTIQADPQEFQRETEALQKVVAYTSNHLVDIFAMVPQNVPPAPSSVFPAQDARLLRYQDVLAKISTNDQSKQLLPSAERTPNVSDGWMSGDEGTDDEPKSQKPVNAHNVGPLLGGFADAQNLE